MISRCTTRAIQITGPVAVTSSSSVLHTAVYTRTLLLRCTRADVGSGHDLWYGRANKGRKLHDAGVALAADINSEQSSCWPVQTCSAGPACSSSRDVLHHWVMVQKKALGGHQTKTINWLPPRLEAAMTLSSTYHTGHKRGMFASWCWC